MNVDIFSVIKDNSFFLFSCNYRIRAVIDSLLLGALNINQTTLVLSFAHLAVGGAYLPATNSSHLIASIRVLTNGTVVIDLGRSDGDVVVDVTGNSTIQVSEFF